MNITKDNIRAFNELYSMGFTEEDFKKFFKKADEITKLGNADGGIIGQGTLQYVMKNANFALSAIFVRNKNTADMAIRKVKDLGLMTAAFGDDTELYFLTYVYGDKAIFISELKEGDIALYRSMLAATLNSYVQERAKNLPGMWNKKYKNMSVFEEEFKNIIRQVLVAGMHQYHGNVWYVSSLEGAEYQAGLLMSKSKVTEISETKYSRILFDNPENVRVVYKVYEEENCRLGIALAKSNSYQGKYYYCFIFLKSTDPLYDYLDAGRIFLDKGQSAYNYSMPASAGGIGRELGVFALMDEVKVPAKPAMEFMLQAAAGNKPTIVVDEARMKLEVRKYDLKTEASRSAEAERKSLDNKIKSKIAVLKTPEGVLKLNDVVYKHNSVEYQGQLLKLDQAKDWVFSIVQSALDSYNFKDINFDYILSRFISRASRFPENGLACTGVIGEIKFKVDIEELTNRNGQVSKRCLINDVRVNFDDIEQCLLRALCYSTQVDYDQFIRTVSSCSLKFHRYLATGIDFSVTDLFGEGTIDFKLPLERKKNLNYIVLGKREFRIKDTNKLISLTNNNDMTDIFQHLMAGHIVEGIVFSDLKEIMKDAKHAFTDAVEKSKLLLKETEKVFKLTPQLNIKMDNGTVVKQGYIIKGTMREYCVEDTEKCAVYEYPVGRYICIVDKSTAQVGADKLVNRIYALHNDQYLVTSISTLR